MRLTMVLAMLVCATLGTTTHGQPLRCPAPILAMTYNIRLDTPSDGTNAWANRRENLIGQIRILRPALIGLQEVLPSQRVDLEESLSDYGFVGGGRDDGKLAGEASPIGIDRRLFRIVSSGTFWLSPTPDISSSGWDAAFPRIASWAHVKRLSDSTRLLVVNTHWDHKGAIARLESGKQLTNWIPAHRQRGEAVILLGDFNTSANDPAIAKMVQSLGLEPASSDASSLMTAPTQSSFNGFEPLPAPGNVIDHIFVGGGASVRLGMVIAQHFNGRLASDHFPAVALLDLPSRRTGPGC